MKQLLPLMLGCVAFSVFADTNSGVHIGVGAGQSKATEASLGLEATDTAYKGFIGYRFNPSLAIEAAYIDGGDFNASYVSQSTTAVSASLLGGFPMGSHANLYAKVGALHWYADTTMVIPWYPYGAYIITETTTGTDLLWGAGLQARAGRIGFRAEYERSEIDGVAYSLVSGSLLFLF